MPEENEQDAIMRPRDIFGPIATLSGLMIAAVGFLHTANLSASVVQGLTDIILMTLIFFVLTAGSASLYAHNGREKYWRASLLLYPISWAIFGLGVALMLVVVAYGITSFKLPAISSIPFSALFVVMSLILMCVSILMSLMASSRNYRQAMENLIGPVGEKIRETAGTELP